MGLGCTVRNVMRRHWVRKLCLELENSNHTNSKPSFVHLFFFLPLFLITARCGWDFFFFQRMQMNSMILQVINYKWIACSSAIQQQRSKEFFGVSPLPYVLLLDLLWCLHCTYIEIIISHTLASLMQLQTKQVKLWMCNASFSPCRCEGKTELNKNTYGRDCSQV